MGGPKDEINWVLSLAYLKAKDIEKGKQLMIEIVEQKSYKASAADRILKELNHAE